MSNSYSTLSHNDLVEMLAYDRESGVFTWKVSTNGRAKVGDFAGCLIKTTGYVVIRKGKMLIPAHRLAWFYSYKQWPEKDIDHIDGNRANNAISNLREANQKENQQNRKSSHSDSSSGILGISFDKVNNKWKAEITAYKKRHFIGRFITKEEASEAYIAAKRKMHPFGTI
jgi:HNH endonuclease/AP2 domain